MSTEIQVKWWVFISILHPSSCIVRSSKGLGDVQYFSRVVKFPCVNLPNPNTVCTCFNSHYFQGVSVMNLFGKARINVNLLIHLINSKFYGRK